MISSVPGGEDGPCPQFRRKTLPGSAGGPCPREGASCLLSEVRRGDAVAGLGDVAAKVAAMGSLTQEKRKAPG